MEEQDLNTNEISKDMNRIGSLLSKEARFYQGLDSKQSNNHIIDYLEVKDISIDDTKVVNLTTDKESDYGFHEENPFSFNKDVSSGSVSLQSPQTATVVFTFLSISAGSISR